MAASLNPYISVFGEEFDAEKSSQYRLTIQLALGGLSYSLLDTQNNRLIALECYQSELLSNTNDLFLALERALESKKLNNSPFQSVCCISDERANMLVPKALFKNDDAETLLNFSFNLPTGLVAFSDELRSLDTVNLFGMSHALQNKITSKWDSVSIVHSATLFLESLPKTDAPVVYLNVRNRDFDMAVKNGKLLFYNNFRFNTKNDFIYFLLFAMDQLGLSGLDTPVNLSGLILPASEIIDLCGRYVRDIRFVADPNELQVSEALSEIPFQYYHILYQGFMI